jgi:hypothetical protein
MFDGHEVGDNWVQRIQSDDPRGREGDVHDQFDVTLEDGDLLNEVELTTTLIIAASESEEHLSQEEIDSLLGVVPKPPEPRRS